MTFKTIFLYVCGLATGVLAYDVALERQHPMPPAIIDHKTVGSSVDGCSRETAAGMSLAASMVSSAGNDRVHECYYR